MIQNYTVIALRNIRKHKAYSLINVAGLAIGIAFADPSFLKIFTFPLVQGDPETALGSPDSLVITETAARKYFGSEDPLGRTLRLANAYDFRVTGIARNIPANSHLQFDFLGNFRVLIKDLGYGTGWWNNDFYTYLRLAPNADFDKLAAAVAMLLVVLAAVGARTARAARANPVDSLRYE